MDRRGRHRPVGGRGRGQPSLGPNLWWRRQLRRRGSRTSCRLERRWTSGTRVEASSMPTFRSAVPGRRVLGRLFSTTSSGACGRRASAPSSPPRTGAHGCPHSPARRSTARRAHHAPAFQRHGGEERWGVVDRPRAFARRAREPCTQTRTGRSPLPGRGASTRPVRLRGPEKRLVSPTGMVHQFRGAFFLFHPRPRPFRVLLSPAFAAGAATPYGHDRAAAAPATYYGSTGTRGGGGTGCLGAGHGLGSRSSPHWAR
jgi:hypothetical protein